MNNPGEDFRKPEDWDRVADFEDVEIVEKLTILKRRRRIAGDPTQPSISETKSIPNLTGIALSGGGIRSASFCLGALQRLHSLGVIGKTDYLSTVSGGGYIGASMIAAMTHEAAKSPSGGNNGPQPGNGNPAPAEYFPFQQPDMRDTPDVGHIRDNSRYLFPKGLNDILRSWGILFRGLAVNVVLVLSVILPLATIVVIANPTVSHLGHSFIADIWWHWAPNVTALLCPCLDPATCKRLPDLVYSYLDGRFLMTKVLLVLTFVTLIAWGLARSLLERQFVKWRTGPEFNSPFAWLLKWLLISFVITFVAEFQTLIIERLVVLFAQPVSLTRSSALASITALMGTSGGLAIFRQQLTNVVANALGTTGFAATSKAFLAKFGLYIAALFMPLVVYVSFLTIATIGISVSKAESPAKFYPSLPDFFIDGAWLLFYISIAAAVCWVIFIIAASIIRDDSDFRSSILQKLRADTTMSLVKLGLIGLALALIWLTAKATRPAANELPDSVLEAFLSMTGIVFIISICFSENANSLHALYRDRLNGAFRLGKGEERTTPLPLTEMNTLSAPYLLINATLNATRSDDAATQGHRFDPAARGRRAEFFLFSRDFIGSDATGYASPSRFGSKARPFDLATAVAISGAAVSSNAGRIVSGFLSPTLALLNARLGYWLDNPQFRYLAINKQKGYRALGGKQKWTEIFRLYLLQEAFGLLRTSSRKLLLSDGGHIDNIGLYQLLKRRCKYIIVIDAEADPAMNFGALADAQRFARIDLGHRVSINWQPMREQARLRNSDRTKPATPEDHDRHFAIGEILYTNQNGLIEKGTLLYIKANVTGDEADYVLDYERRYPTFPHETTVDQLFSEEQMEAYRALGFHSVDRAFSLKRNSGVDMSGQLMLDLKTSLCTKAPGAPNGKRNP